MDLDKPLATGVPYGREKECCAARVELGSFSSRKGPPAINRRTVIIIITFYSAISNYYFPSSLLLFSFISLSFSGVDLDKPLATGGPLREEKLPAPPWRRSTLFSLP